MTNKMSQINCNHEQTEIYTEVDIEVTYCVNCEKELDFKRFVSDEEIAIFGEY